VTEGKNGRRMGKKAGPPKYETAGNIGGQNDKAAKIGEGKT